MKFEWCSYNGRYKKGWMKKVLKNTFGYVLKIGLNSILKVISANQIVEFKSKIEFNPKIAGNSYKSHGKKRVWFCKFIEFYVWLACCCKYHLIN